VRFTQKDGAVYAICLGWPGEKLAFPNVTGAKAAEASMLGLDGPLAAAVDADTVSVTIPALTPDKLPCRHVWVVKLTLK